MARPARERRWRQLGRHYGRAHRLVTRETGRNQWLPLNSFEQEWQLRERRMQTRLCRDEAQQCFREGYDIGWKEVEQ